MTTQRPPAIKPLRGDTEAAVLDRYRRGGFGAGKKGLERLNRYLEALARQVDERSTP